MKKMLFVMNPYSGQRKANRVLAEIISAFNSADYRVEVHMTSGVGDATKVVAERAAEMDLIVCCGGDGTFNETVTGLMTSGVRVPVGYIPAGSTNDFANSLHLPTECVEAADAIITGCTMDLDVGKFAERYFSYVASFGAFTRVSYETPQSIKNALGHTAYVLGGISELSQIRTEHLKLDIDGEIVEDDFLFGAICNSTSLGGVFTLDPSQVDMCDGRLEVILVRAPQSLAEIAECIQAVQSQKYNNCEMITFRSAREIHVEASPYMLWTLDGEREEGHAEVVIQACHKALQLVKGE